MQRILVFGIMAIFAAVLAGSIVIALYRMFGAISVVLPGM